MHCSASEPRALGLALIGLLFTACTPSAAPETGKQEEAPPPQATPAAPEVTTPALPTPPKSIDAKPEPATPEIPATPAEVVAEVVVPVPENARVVPVIEIAPAPTTVQWREVARPTEAVTFEPLMRGVLGRSASGLLDIDANGALVLRAEIEAPKGQVLGAWPDNAWVIERRELQPDRNDRSGFVRKQIRLVRLRGNKRWVPQMYDGEQRFDDHGERFAIGGKGGMIVQRGCLSEYDEPPDETCDGNALSRVSDKLEDPELGVDVGGSLVGFFETRAGQVYTARQKDDVVFVQSDCDSPECVATQANQLPHGPRWEFTWSTARQKHGISAVAEASTTDGIRTHLLHYETGGWKLEQIAGTPAGLWSTDDGGLWTFVDDTLLHRDPSGAWREIAMPPGATTASVAMASNGSELWLSAAVDGSPVVFATAARAQTPPAAEPAVAPTPAVAPESPQ